MRILADENVPGDLVTFLRSQGHDINWIRTDCPGLSDALVLDRATQEQRTLVTFDKDYGELIFHLGHDAPYGLLLVRISMRNPTTVYPRLADILRSRTNWGHCYAVVTDRGVRMISLGRPQDG